MEQKSDFRLYVRTLFASHLSVLSISVVCFVSIIPLEKLFDFGGEQMALYTGKDLGDLIIVTLNKCVAFLFCSVAPAQRRLQCRRSHPSYNFVDQMRVSFCFTLSPEDGRAFSASAFLCRDDAPMRSSSVLNLEYVLINFRV